MGNGKTIREAQQSRMPEILFAKNIKEQRRYRNQRSWFMIYCGSERFSVLKEAGRNGRRFLGHEFMVCVKKAWWWELPQPDRIVHSMQEDCAKLWDASS